MINSKYKSFYISTSKQQFKQLSDLLFHLEKKSSSQNLIENIFRLIHSMKGASATMGYKKTVKLLHTMESIVDAAFKGNLIINSKIINLLFDTLGVLKDNLASIDKKDKEINLLSQTKALQAVLKIKQKSSNKKKVEEKHILGSLPSVAELNVSTDKLDLMHNFLDDLFINSMRIKNIAKESSDVEFLKICVENERILSSLRRQFKNIRVVALKDVLSSLPYLVREISRNANKNVNLIIRDHNISLDKSVVDEIMEILIQLLKNAVSHGITKDQKGGKIIVDFSLLGDRVHISVSDNGQGINWSDIVKTAVKNKAVSPSKVKSMTLEDKKDLIFYAGISKGEDINTVSGRGIGLNLVKNKVEELQGSIDVHSSSSKGTEFIIDLPQPLSIFRAIIFNILDYRLAVPLDWLEKIVSLEEVDNFSGRKIFTHQKNRYHVLDMFKFLDIKKFDVLYKYVALINHDDYKVALPLMRKVDEDELIMKQKPLVLKNNKKIKGVAVSAKGQVVLVLDPAFY